MSEKHRHAAEESLSKIVAYSGGVARAGTGTYQNPKSSGGITTVETCRCGCVRRVNSNGRAVEYGPWVKA